MQQIQNETFAYDTIDSPLGELLLVARGEALAGIFLDGHRGGRLPGLGWVRDPRRLAEARKQLEEYFAGSRRSFDLPLSPNGTEFQRRVWGELERIPFGETITYGELARRTGGTPGAA